MNPVSFVAFVFLWASSALGVKIQGIDVQIGHDGTDDIPKVSICGNLSKGTPACCTTNSLDHSWTNDWSKNDDETWEGFQWLGSCMNKEFQPDFLEVVIRPTGDDDFILDNISLMTDSGLFDCGSIHANNGRIDRDRNGRNYCFNL